MNKPAKLRFRQYCHYGNDCRKDYCPYRHRQDDIFAPQPKQCVFSQAAINASAKVTLEVQETSTSGIKKIDETTPAVFDVNDLEIKKHEDDLKNLMAELEKMKARDAHSEVESQCSSKTPTMDIKESPFEDPRKLLYKLIRMASDGLKKKIDSSTLLTPLQVEFEFFNQQCNKWIHIREVAVIAKLKMLKKVGDKVWYSFNGNNYETTLKSVSYGIFDIEQLNLNPQ